MSNTVFKPLFQRTLSEQSKLINPQVKRVQQENISRGLYNSYRDARYKSNDILIRKYEDHREVIKVNAITGLTQTIKTIR
ncbi:hypothetical protein ABIB62_001000 [Mucilaginibacter sp. UYP25]